MRRTEVLGAGAVLQHGLLRGFSLVARHAHYRGMQRLSWVLGRWFAPENHAVVETRAGRMRVMLNDGYWTCLLIPSYVYEPEVESVLRRLFTALPNAFFLDCGANIGYWSLFAGRLVDRSRVVAVEANPEVYRRLIENLSLNGAGVTALRLAVWEVDGQELVLQADKQQHAGGTVVGAAPGQDVDGYPVTSITIDSLLRKYVGPGDFVIVKLDVEGAEVPSLRSAGSAFHQRKSVLLFEDHGSDKQHRTTAFVLLEMGLSVYAPRLDGSLVRISSLSQLDQLKTIPYKGYNFLACSPLSDTPASLEALFEIIEAASEC